MMDVDGPADGPHIHPRAGLGDVSTATRGGTMFTLMHFVRDDAEFVVINDGDFDYTDALDAGYELDSTHVLDGGMSAVLPTNRRLVPN
jgi:hypothetical protein